MNMKTILIDAVHTLIIKGEGLYQPLFDLLEEYQNRKIVLTNADDEQMKDNGLLDFPYEVFTLKHNPDKNNPLYFKMFLEVYGLKNDEVIYVEHDLEAVKSAESVGIKTFFYDSEEKDLYSVREFIEVNGRIN